MKNFLSAFALPLLVVAQTITVNEAVLNIEEVILSPAASTLNTDVSDSAAELFTSETVQLTDAVIANLTGLDLSDIDLFSFEDSPSSTVARRKRTALAALKCKTYSGDILWPSTVLWQLFDIFLGGALIKTIPYAAPCYDAFGIFDQVKCDFISENWMFSSIYHTADPTSVNGVLYQGSTCQPPNFNPTNKECTVGGYPEYAVAVTNVAQIQLSINLARSLNLRLVIKNTSHDFSAKSTGKGALSIWTHNLKSVKFYKSYSYNGYSGPAFKLGAGIQAFELYEVARANNVTAVGGEGRTVGVTGGYIAGGGHSPLSSLYGMGADQVLSMEIVLADGRFVTASATSNSDLFFALCGGGGSTFDVVTSLVLKVYPKIQVTTMTFAIVTSPTLSAEKFWSALRIYFDYFITYTHQGNYEYFFVTGTGPGQFSFSMAPWFAPGMSKVQLQALVAPMFARWAAIGVVVEPVYTEYSDFYDAWYASFPNEPFGVFNRVTSRLLPKTSWQNEAKLNETFAAFKETVEGGAYAICFNIAAAPTTGFPDNGVNPAWRKTVMHVILASFWDIAISETDQKIASDKVTFDWGKKLQDVSPSAGAYISESDYIEPNFQQSFFGSRYAKLLQIKQKYDPNELFYAHEAVGSEKWKMSEFIFGNLPSQISKLCRV